MSSVLEQASASSDSSSVLIDPSERSLPMETEEEESEDRDTDTVEEEEDDENESKKDETKTVRRSLRRLQTDMTSPPPCTGHEDVSSASPSTTSRYSLRTRQKKPKRFDESIYNDVFMNSHLSYAESAITRKKRRRRYDWNHRHHSKRQCRSGSEDEKDKGLDLGMKLREVPKKRNAQERDKSQEVTRRTHSSRYSLRSRESLIMSEISDVASAEIERRIDGTKRSQLEVSVDDDDTKVGHDNDDEDEDSQSENDDAKTENEHEEEEEEGDEVRVNSSRYHLRQRRQAPTSNSMITRSRTKASPAPGFDTEDTSRRYLLRDRSKTIRTDAQEDAVVSPETSAYAEYHKRQVSRSLRKSSTSGTGSNRRLFRSELDSSPRSRRRQSRVRSKFGRRTRHHRSLSSSSSGSSSSSNMHNIDDDDDDDDDDSDGGMRTSSPWRSSKSMRKSASSRADITPVKVDRRITWDSVGGLKTHIEALKEMVMLPLLYPEFYDKYKVAPPSGVLFYGPPGTGKTLLARALANSCSLDGKEEQSSDLKHARVALHGKKKERVRRHVTFYMRKGADCLSKWVGEAERQLRLLFDEAKRNQPSIIFFDEIDGLAPVRSAKQDQIHASIVSTLLALMDGMDSRGRVVVIGATNRLDAIDPALRRPGRFDRELGFKLPSVKERKSMLAIHSRSWKPRLSDTFLTHLAEQTVGYCGADIKALCAEAALCCLRRVYPQVYASEAKLLINLDKVLVARGDFIKAAKKITPASHRAVSSFAAPLPRAVKVLLQPQLAKVLRDVARHFPLFPLDQTSIDDAVITGHDSGEDSTAEDEDDVDIYEALRHDDCDVCHGNDGELLGCDACPRAFHSACLVDTTQETRTNGSYWFCPDCRGSNSTVQGGGHRGKRVESIASLQLPRHSGFPRVLITGKAGMGQQYIGPALLHSLEGLTHFSLDYPSLVADSKAHGPEEALIQRLTEAQKCLPCVLYLPQIEYWWRNTSESMHLTLKMMLTNLQVRANLPILFLACTASSSCAEQSLPEDLLALFRADPSVSATSVVMELDTPSKAARLAHFKQLFDAIATPPCAPKPKRAKGKELEVLPLAPLPPAASEIKLTTEEQKKRRERDFHFLRELRIFLSQVLVYCYSQKVYTPFFVPVDPVAVPNYYLIVKHPMDLSTMRDKLNDEEYTCFEQFMDDIQLIVRNANVFNPKRSRTRHIAHAAGTMKDNILSYAHRFRIRQGYDLFAKCRDVTKRLQAYPSMYGEYGQRFSKATRARNRKNSVQGREKPSVRTSARLRGVKAPEINLETAFSPAMASVRESNSNGVSVKKEAFEARNGNEGVTQWFDDEEEEEKEKEVECTKTESSEEVDGNKTGTAMERDCDHQVFDEGDRIFVSSRTHPGINREGGAGVVQSRNKDGTYNVKYILGGSEKAVSVKYIRRLTDDAVMESVKTQRSVAASSMDATGSVRLIQDEEKMDETDYFDELLWPILKEEGWRRDDKFDIIEASGKESGLAVQRVVFTPSTKRNGESVTLTSVLEALEYVSADPELSKKCFGFRYGESLMTTQVLNGNSSDEESVEMAEASCDNCCTLEVNAEEPMADVREKEPMEDVQETPDFIYDEARMALVLTKLVEKTANWSVDKLRDELLVLNKLAYPFRNQFDRTKLMMLIETHEKMMQ